MKTIKLLIFTAGILLMGFLSGCESSDNKDYPVAISFNNTTAVDSAFISGNYTLKGTVKADGPIKMVQFYRNFIINGAQDSVEMAATRIININKDTCNFTIHITNVAYQTHIRVVATQNDGSQTSALYTVNKSVRDTLIAYPGIQLGGLTSDYHSGVDFDNGVGVSATSSSLDAFFDIGEFGSTDLSQPTSPRFSDTGTRFATTNFTFAQFDSFTDDGSILSMKATLSVIPVKQGDVILFQTAAGRKGLLRIVSLTDPLGDLVVDEKIQK